METEHRNIEKSLEKKLRENSENLLSLKNESSQEHNKYLEMKSLYEKEVMKESELFKEFTKNKEE